MPSARKPSAPAGLKKGGKKLWTETVGEFDLRVDELQVLEDACRERDLIDRMEAELAKGQLIVQGSMKQPVANPLTTEIRQHRTTFRALMAQLKLPDDPGEEAPSSRATSARKAAAARWGVGA